MSIDYRSGKVIEGEIATHGLTAEAARALTDQIRATLTTGHDLLIAAFRGRAWSALGYKNWNDYCAGEFAESRMVRLYPEQRLEIVAEMRRAGMGTKAIGSAMGVSHETARTDIQELGRRGVDLPDRIQSLDGIERPAERAWKPPVIEVSDKPRKSPRRPLNETARHAGLDLMTAVERIERVLDDDRYRSEAEQVAPLLRNHLTSAIETCQGLLNRIDD